MTLLTFDKQSKGRRTVVESKSSHSNISTVSCSVKEPNIFHKSTMKLRKSLVKPVTRQKTCNRELFGSSARDRYVRRRTLWTSADMCRVWRSPVIPNNTL